MLKSSNLFIVNISYKKGIFQNKSFIQTIIMAIFAGIGPVNKNKWILSIINKITTNQQQLNKHQA